MAIFLDSSFVIAAEVETDQNHEKAAGILNDISSGIYGNAIISDYIFSEIVTVTFLRTKELAKAVFAGENLKKSTKIVKIDESIFELAWKIFQSQNKTKFSFTDCTILAVMNEKGVNYLATFDEDFNHIKGVSIVS